MHYHIIIFLTMKKFMTTDLKGREGGFFFVDMGGHYEIILGT